MNHLVTDTTTSSSLKNSKLDNTQTGVYDLAEKKGEESENLPSVEKVLQELDPSTRDTSSEAFINEECLDNSALEVIHLLNDTDKNCSSDINQTCENSETDVKTAVKRFECQTFSSYDEFRKTVWHLV